MIPRSRQPSLRRLSLLSPTALMCVQLRDLHNRALSRITHGDSTLLQVHEKDMDNSQIWRHKMKHRASENTWHVSLAMCSIFFVVLVATIAYERETKTKLYCPFLILLTALESFYDSRHNFLFFNEIAVFETSSRPYLPKYGVPSATPTSSFDSPFFANKKMKGLFSTAYFLESRSHETFFEDNRCFWWRLS